MAMIHGAKLRALLLGVFMALCGILAACSDGVAATVQGHTISEDEVTQYIESFRAGTQCTDDESWAAYLADKDVTAKELRTATIEELAVPVIVGAKADELGISVEEGDVDVQIDALRNSLLAADDESWRSELARYGMTEEKLRENFKGQQLRKLVLEAVAGDVEPTDEDLRNYAAENLAGMSTKKIACAYGGDYGAVYAAMEAVQRASSPAAGMRALKASAKSAGVDYADVGWDISAELTPRMRNVVDHLEQGELADAPLSEGGIYYLFYIEDVYTFPDDVSELELDDESLKAAVGELAGAAKKEAAGEAWLQERLAQDVVVRDMPSGLSYDVSPKAAAPAAESGSAGNEEKHAE